MLLRWNRVGNGLKWKLGKVKITNLGIGIGTFQKHFWMQTHNNKPVRVGQVFSTPGSIKSSKPNIKIGKVDWSLRAGRVIEKIKKENGNKMVHYIKFALHFSFSAPTEGLFRRAKYIIHHFSFFAFFLHLFCHSSFRNDQLTFFFLIATLYSAYSWLRYSTWRLWVDGFTHPKNMLAMQAKWGVVARHDKINC